MIYDMTYHPISAADMQRYAGCVSSDEFASKSFDSATMSDPARHRLFELLASFRPPSDRGFDQSHGAYMAIFQGFFTPYFYVRGCMLSAVGPVLAPYLAPLATIHADLPGVADAINQVQGGLSSGVYIPADKVLSFMEDAHADADLASALSAQFPPPEFAVLWAALLAAQQSGVGLLEAAGVVQQHPEDPSNVTCFSDLDNCDPVGLAMFKEAATSALAATPTHQPHATPADWQRLVAVTATPYQVDDQLASHFDDWLKHSQPVAAFTSATSGMGIGMMFDWKEGYLVEQRCRDIVDQHLGWSDEDFWRMAELQFTCGEDVDVDQGLAAFTAWLKHRQSGHTLVSTTTNADYYFSILHPEESAGQLIAALASCGIEARVQAPSSAPPQADPHQAPQPPPPPNPSQPAAQPPPPPPPNPSQPPPPMPSQQPAAQAPAPGVMPWEAAQNAANETRTTAGTERGLSARLRARRDAEENEQPD